MELILLPKFNWILNFKPVNPAKLILKILLLWNYKVTIILASNRTKTVIWKFMDIHQSIKMKISFQISSHWTIRIYHKTVQSYIIKFTLALKLKIQKIVSVSIKTSKRRKMISLLNMNSNSKMNSNSQKKIRRKKTKPRIFTEIWETLNYW
jgi:hypothetical protein